MKLFARAIVLLLPLLFTTSAAAADPPEIVAPHRAPADLRAAAFEPLFEVQPIRSPLLGKIRAVTWHAGCPVAPEDLRQLNLSYWNFDRRPSTGILLVHKDVALEVTQIFRDLFRHGFLIEKMTPVEEYQGDDDASMAANNTSAFNCRDVTGQPGKFSNHSWGRAIDINPLTNPYVKGGKVLPPQGRRYLDRTLAFPGSVLSGGFVVKRFAKSGWQWGGAWADRQDYQHFEKPAPGRH